MIPYPWEFPEKNMEKNFLMGISMRFTILWEIPLSTFSHGKSPPQEKIFPMGNPHHLFSPTPMGNSHYFFPYGKSPLFLSTPYGKSPKKNLEKKFSSGYMDNCSPKNGGAPWGEGAWGDTYPPPMGYMGGVIIKIACYDYLSRLLVKITCSGTCSVYF